MKILFICDYYTPHLGGAELIYKKYCEGLASRGYSVDTVTLRHSGNLPKIESIGGVTIHRIDTPWNSRYLFPLFSLQKVLNYLKNADIIHCAFFVSPFSAVPSAKLKGKPVIVTVHEVWNRMWFRFERNFPKAIVNYLGENLLTALPYDAVTCYSTYTLNSLHNIGIDKEKIKYIPNGVDLKLFRPRIGETELKTKLTLEGFKVYMFYGRLGISKGVEYLVKAAASIKERIKDSKLLMILGKEPRREYQRILHLINTLRLKDHICLLDPVPHEDLPRYISLADVVVVPSLSEGFGFTAAEAAAMEKPIVATYGGSLPEIISHEESGLLVQPGSPAEICNAVCRLLHNENEAQRMGKTARVNISRFNWNQSIDLLEALYKHLVK